MRWPLLVADFGARRLAFPRVNLQNPELAAGDEIKELRKELREARRREEANYLEVVRVEGHGFLKERIQQNTN